MLVAGVKWALAEIIRCKSTLSIAETSRLVSSIVERQVPVLWKNGGVRRVLRPGVPAKKQVMVLLYDKSPSTEAGLREAVEYRSRTDFRSKVLKPLHGKRLIEFNARKGSCQILPTGVSEAEKIILALEGQL